MVKFPKKWTVDELKVTVSANRAEMGKAAGADIAACMRRLLAEKERIRMIFAAAPSQNETLAALLEEALPWERVDAFHMDEYVGLSPDAPQRFGNYLREHLFDKVHFGSVHYLEGGADDPEKECIRYAAALKESPVDIVVLGIGENGHIAFNDPGVADFDDPETVKKVKLDEVCRQQQVNDGCFASLADVPTHALTLTVPTLFAGKHLFCSVPSGTKRAAVYATLCGAIGAAVPATVMRKHPDAALYCDPDSAADFL